MKLGQEAAKEQAEEEEVGGTHECKRAPREMKLLRTETTKCNVIRVHAVCCNVKHNTVVHYTGVSTHISGQHRPFRSGAFSIRATDPGRRDVGINEQGDFLIVMLIVQKLHVCGVHLLNNFYKIILDYYYSFTLLKLILFIKNSVILMDSKNVRAFCLV